MPLSVSAIAFAEQRRYGADGRKVKYTAEVHGKVDTGPHQALQLSAAATEAASAAETGEVGKRRTQSTKSVKD